MTFDNYLGLFLVFALFVFLVVYAFIDLRKQWQRQKRDELRLQKFIDNVSVISAYFFYKGLSEGFEMGRSIEDIVEERFIDNKFYK